jgi:chromatin structure-remodeling complex subunit RSC9
MAPRQREPSIERSDEYERFIKDLEQYHEKRGTHFEAEPKVGPRHLDLLKLYQRVTEEGGYDKASDTKGNKLAWRRIAGEFLPGSSNVVQLAFLVKTAYYKNLAYGDPVLYASEPSSINSQ